MSYILRALKKSQQERERGSVPKLTRVPEPTPRQERRLWPWWLAGALAVNLAAVAGGLWWLGGGPEPGTVASGEAVAGIVRLSRPRPQRPMPATARRPPWLRLPRRHPCRRWPLSHRRRPLFRRRP
jgi:general secretion pathway protein B